MAHLTSLPLPLPLLIPLLLLTTTTGLTAQTPPVRSGPASPAQGFLQPHNQARSAVGVAPLKWSQTLSEAAGRVVTYQKAKHSCQFANLSSAATKYGANQLWARGAAVSPGAAVAAWVAEKRYYDYKSDTCAAGHQCGVYKQVVWRKTAELGCAQGGCVKDGSSLTVCFYNPPGNVVGEKPY